MLAYLLLVVLVTGYVIPAIIAFLALQLRRNLNAQLGVGVAQGVLLLLVLVHALRDFTACLDHHRRRQIYAPLGIKYLLNFNR